jgi:hypothetical protein
MTALKRDCSCLALFSCQSPMFTSLRENIEDVHSLEKFPLFSWQSFL